MKGFTITMAQMTQNVLNVQYGFKGHSEIDLATLPVIAQAFIAKPIEFVSESAKFAVRKAVSLVLPEKEPAQTVLPSFDARSRFRDRPPLRHAVRGTETPSAFRA